MLRRSFLVLSAIAVVIVSAPASSQTTCTLTNIIESGPSGALTTLPYGMNKYGAVARTAAPLQENQASRPPQVSTDEIPEETPDDELAPAALRLDLSTAPPIIQTLYQATRETKESDILARLQQVRGFIDGGADLKATDPQGRTPLHWAIFGSSYHTNQKLVVAYEDLANVMLDRGVDLNRQDVYQNTALDYLLYSPSFEMQTLLLESGANSGFLAGVFRSSAECNAPSVQPPAMPVVVSRTREAQLYPGATLSIRLDVPVYSDRSRLEIQCAERSRTPCVRTASRSSANQASCWLPQAQRSMGRSSLRRRRPTSTHDRGWSWIFQILSTAIIT
jgi:hypothetical protein